MTRISELPRRDWTVGANDLVGEMSAMLRTPYGTQTLRPIQAAMLLEAAEVGGLAANARVGAGKTLVSGLLPTVMGAKRPLLLVPAALVDKTEAEFAKLRDHWQIPNQLRVASYSKLGVARHSNLLWDYKPDLIICDEAHKLKHVTKSAVARRVARYLFEFPATRTAALSGTLTNGSLLHYAHIIVWALRQGAPIPIQRAGQEEWAAALDPKTPKRADPVALVPDLGPGVTHGIELAREAFRDRFVSTPGVVVSVDAYTGASLNIDPITLTPPAATSSPFDDLRTLWVAPDGWMLADARFEVWAVARQLALGFYYRHDPWPPDDWFDVRKRYCKMVRTVIAHSERFDSALQVSEACASDDLPSECADVWREWREIEPTFKIHKVPVWLSDFAIDAAEKWGRAGHGIIWTEHRAFAQRLAKRTGWALFGSKGVDATGREIESIRNETIIASIKANGTGKNLQYGFFRSLVTSPLTSAEAWEQLLGRTHREEQPSPHVNVNYLVSAYEHITAIQSALEVAAHTFETFGQPQKLLDAGVTPPTGGRSHSAWTATTSK